MVHVAWRDFRSPDGREGWFPAHGPFWWLIAEGGASCRCATRPQGGRATRQDGALRGGDGEVAGGSLTASATQGAG